MIDLLKDTRCYTNGFEYYFEYYGETGECWTSTVHHVSLGVIQKVYYR